MSDSPDNSLLYIKSWKTYSPVTGKNKPEVTPRTSSPTNAASKSESEPTRVSLIETDAVTLPLFSKSNWFTDQSGAERVPFIAGGNQLRII